MPEKFKTSTGVHTLPILWGCFAERVVRAFPSFYKALDAEKASMVYGLRTCDSRHVFFMCSHPRYSSCVVNCNLIVSESCCERCMVDSLPKIVL